MGRMIGIDLGRPTRVAAVMDGGPPRVIPSREGAAATPTIVGFWRGTRAARGREPRGGWPSSESASAPSCAVVRLVGRTLDRTTIAGGRPLRALPARGRRQRRPPRRDRGRVLLAARDRRDAAARAQGRRGGAPAARRSRRPSSAVPSSFDDLQRQAVGTRPGSPGSRLSPRQRLDRGRPQLRARQRRVAAAASPSATSAAARSTCRSWSWPTGSSRFARRAATRRSAGSTSTGGSRSA